MIDTTNTNTALASALVDELARAGCRRAVLCPGSRSTPVSLALARHPEIEASVVLDERVAAFVALGIGLATGVPAPVSVTSGSAAANLHPAVVEADQGNVPLILLTSDRPPELRDIGAGQTIDQVKLFGSAARWFSEVGTHAADDAGLLHYRSTGARAVAEAISGAGPVHLNLSWRDPLGPEPVEGAVTAQGPLALQGRPEGGPISRLHASRAPSAEDLDLVSELLRTSSKPLIIAGRNRCEGLREVLPQLARSIGAPILAEPTSGLRFGGAAHDPIVAAYELICRQLPQRLRPDLILRFGEMPTSKALRAVAADPEVRQVVVTPANTWNDPTRHADLIVQADPVALAAALALARSSSRSDQSFLSAWLECEARAQDAIDAGLPSQLSEPAIHRELHRHLSQGAGLLLASSMPIRDAESFSPATEIAIDVIANRGANGIDGLTSTATGAALGSSDPTVAVLGDLATLHDLGGLDNLGVAGADLRLLVINNGGGRIFEFLPQYGQMPEDEFRDLFTTPSGLDFRLAAELAGIAYDRITDVSGLAALGKPGPRLVEAVVEPSGNVALHRELADRVAEAIR